jgi:hypothetical protein
MSFLIPDTDKKYFLWMKKNPFGFVVNIKKQTLHRTNCPHITSDVGFPKGIFTEMENVKVCFNKMDEIHNWMSKKKMNFDLYECRTCNPLGNKK